MKRWNEIIKLKELINRYPVTAIICAHQVGKTILARIIISSLNKPVHYFDLEIPEYLAKLADPVLALKYFKGIVVIDEVQRLPALFPILRVVIDQL